MALIPVNPEDTPQEDVDPQEDDLKTRLIEALGFGTPAGALPEIVAPTIPGVPVAQSATRAGELFQASESLRARDIVGALEGQTKGLAGPAGLGADIIRDPKQTVETLAAQAQDVIRGVTGGGVADELGLIEPKQIGDVIREGGGTEEQAMIGGLAAEIATDPLTFIGGNLIKAIPRNVKALAKPTTKKLFETIIKEVPGLDKDVAVRVADAMSEIQKLRPGQVIKQRQELSKRVQAAISIDPVVTGEKRFASELAKLKGELEKSTLEPIRQLFNQEGIDSMFKAVDDSINLTFFSRIQAKAALAKLLNKKGVEIPFPSELEPLKEVFGKSFVDVIRKPSTFERVKELGIEIANLPRAIQSSFDLSAPLRQGLFFISRPKQFFSAIKPMVKGFFSEKAFKETMQEILGRPNAPLYDIGGLDLTRIGTTLSKREEAFIGANLAEKIPLVGRGVRASNRGFNTFLNKLRADVFDNIHDTARKAGYNVEDKKFIKSLAKMVNAGTGRADIPGFKKAMSELSTVFYSPRFLASRIELLNPGFYASLDPFVRKEAIKSLIGTTAILGTTLGLASMIPGLEVENDTRSTDFGKIKIGNTRIDILGGAGQPIVALSRIIQGESKSPVSGKITELGEGFGTPTRKDIALRFLVSKAAPLVSLGLRFLEGTDFAGEPIEAKKEILRTFLPLFVQDLIEATREHGLLEGTLIAAPGFFGAGVQTFAANKASRSRRRKKSTGKSASDLASELGI